MVGDEHVPQEGEAADAWSRLREVEERLRLFMANVRDYAIFMTDPEGRVVDWNVGAEHLLGYGPEILGQPFWVFFPPDDVRQGIPQQELKTAATCGRASDDRWHVRKDGTYFWATGETTPLRDEQGNLKGFTKVLRDSTERKHFEEELSRRNDSLEEMDRRKDEFLAVLAHELRNPLGPIFNALQLLEDERITSEAARENRQIIHRQVRQLTRLVDDLLDVSRITSGKILLRKQLVQVQQIVGHAVQTCKPFIDARGRRLVVESPAEPLWFEADPTRMEQVLGNLLNNAAKYSEEGGQIMFAVARRGNDVEFCVRDDGVGIPPELLPRVFDLFAQADSSLDRSQGGLGIGLTLVKKLTEMHGGHVAAQSEGAGKGSVFTVTLPLSFGKGQTAVADSAPPRLERSESPLHVLVVDDNHDATETMRHLLTAMGHRAAAANSGQTALELAERLKPDVIIMDIGLPGLSGYQVAERIRQMPELKSVILFALTGYGSAEDEHRSKEAGFDYHLVKPVDAKTMQTFLANVAKQR